MNIQFIKFDLDNQNHLGFLVKWENDSELNHLLIPRRDDSPMESLSIETLKKRYLDSPKFEGGTWMIQDGEKLIGYYSLMMNPGHLFKKGEETSWLGLTVGDRNYWGKGVAQKAMKHYEENSKKHKAVRIELGVFEFNKRAYDFYLKLGFQEIGRISDFTYWDGKFWQDIRMEKYLI